MHVTAETLARSGHGIAQTEGLEVHVPDLLPGESAEVRVAHKSPHQPRAWAEILERTNDTSPDRQRPHCPAFGRCGGCVWQHLRYGAQLDEKVRRVTDALGHAPDQVVAAPSETHYRNRGNYVVGPNGELGAYEPRSHAFVSTAGCQVVEPAIARAAASVQTALTSLAPYDEKTRTGHLRYVVLRANVAGEILCAVVTTSDAPTVPAGAIEASSVVQVKNDETHGVILTDRIDLLSGDGTLTERVCGVDVRIDVRAFLQVNRVQGDALYQLVADWIDAPSAVDLYSGVGGFAFALAQKGIPATGIESVASAVAAAARAAGPLPATFVHGDASLLSDHAAPALIVDPPRKGLSKQVLDAIAETEPAKLVYVSCHLPSLVRDRAALRGYRLARVAALDLMPGTPEIETVAQFERLTA